MSTGQQCDIIEEHPGRWYLWLESMIEWGEDEAGRGDGEMIRQGGPFKSKDETLAHLHAYHANPGGFSTWPHDPLRREIHGEPLSPITQGWQSERPLRYW